MKHECPTCGQETKLSPKDRKALKDAAAYRSFVEEHGDLIDAIGAVIERHIVENKAGAVGDCYSWPESEAVVILRHLPELVAIVGGDR